MKTHKILPKKFTTKILICVSLTMCFWGIYLILYQHIKNIYTSVNENTKTIDCAPVIDAYGVEEDYYLEFELKTEVPGTVLVYFENGSNARYAFYEYIETGTEYKKYSMVVKPVLRDEAVQESFLAFYGQYGTGIISTVKNIKFEFYEDK